MRAGCARAGRESGCWRLAAAFAALVASLGVLLSLAGTSGLIGRQPAVGIQHIEPAAGGVLLALGLLSLCLGVFFWRFSPPPQPPQRRPEPAAEPR